MQHPPESERNHPLIAALFPHLPRQRFSWPVFFLIFGITLLLGLVQTLNNPHPKKSKPATAQPAVALEK